MAITLDIARDNPNAHTVSAEAVLPGEDKPTLIGLSREELQAKTEAPLAFADDCKEMAVPAL